MSKPILLDLYCGAGGAGMGYARAGFRVIGVDRYPQPRYPFEFHQGDALSVVNWGAFSAVHASPPCKTNTALRAFSSSHHVDLIASTRGMLDAAGLPYVIENTPPHAAMRVDLTLCGSMFNLDVRRHRWFEMNGFDVPQIPCRHAEQEAGGKRYMVKRYHSGHPVITPSAVIGVYGRGQGLGPGEVQVWRDAMGIQWMVRDELSQAIPPAYTEYIGAHLMKRVRDE